MSITIEEMQKQVHNLAREKGWWPYDIMEMPKDGQDRNINLKEVNIPEKLALMHSELSEALEFYRNNNEGQGIDDVWVIYNPIAPDKPDGMWVELADCIIRIFDLAGAYEVDMETLVRLKHEYNKTRPYRHGGKKC